MNSFSFSRRFVFSSFPLSKPFPTLLQQKRNMTFTLKPVVPSEKQSGVDFGAIVTDLDLETISRKVFFFSFSPGFFLSQKQLTNFLYRGRF